MSGRAGVAAGGAGGADDGEATTAATTGTAAATTSTAAGAARPPLTGRARLRSALRPRATRAQVASGLLCMLLGLALVVQVRQHSEEDYASLREAELIGLLDDTSDRADQLQREVRELTRTREELLSSSDQSEAARALARERLDVLGVLAGTLPATGPGIELVLSGEEVDAALLLSAVQELRDAGAEAIQLGEVRVVASTYFVDAPDPGDGQGPVVEVDGTLVRAPFTFLAIGSSRTLASAMDFPGGVLPTVSSRGGTGYVQQRERVDVTAVRPAEEPVHARPAETAPDPAP